MKPMLVRPAVLVLLLTATALVGCVQTNNQGPAGPGAPFSLAPGKLRCLDENSTKLCNFHATVDPADRQANELSIAVNPTNPNNVIVTGKDYTPDFAGDCTWDGLYATLDGGKTWKDQSAPGSPWKRLKDPTEPLTPLSNFYCVTDPVVAFGPDGTAYWALMPYQCDPLSGSKTGAGVIPANPVSQLTGASNGGGLNDWLWTCSSMYIAVSHDGGMTWPTDELRQLAFGPRLENDKGWLTVAPDGTVLYCWDHAPPTSAAPTVLPPDPLPGVPPTDGAMVCEISQDKGNTWSEMKNMNVGWAGAFPFVDYGPDNTAYDVSVDGQNVVVSKSRDGLTWEMPVTVSTYTDPPPNEAALGFPGLKNSKFRIFNVPAMAVDRSSGPYSGRIYVTWMNYDTATDNANVLVSWSGDGGATWSAPAKVHDDNATHPVDHFMTAISVGPDGTVDVSWYDRRDDPANHLFDIYYTYSLDGGKTWAKNLRVTEVSSDEQYSHHQNGAIFIGDYRDSDSSAGLAHLTWVDTRNHKADAYVATIERPGANSQPR